MGRIIPWDLPKVNGGSIGGYTPEPTPEPPQPEITTPYILDDATFSLSGVTTEVQTWVNTGTGVSITKDAYISTDLNKLGVSISTSGIVINDTSAVNSIIAHCKISSENYSIRTQASSGSSVAFNKIDILFDVDITAAMVSRGGSITPSQIINYGVSTKNGKYINLWITVSQYDLLSIDVYNGAGVVLQSWTPEAAE